MIEVETDLRWLLEESISRLWALHDEFCGGTCDCDKVAERIGGIIEAAIARESAAQQERARLQEPQIDCPLCGVTVKQVASATLSLALWQHVNWVCQSAQQDRARTTLICHCGYAMLPMNTVEHVYGCTKCGNTVRLAASHPLPTPLCECGHGADYHGNDGTGHCGATVACRSSEGCTQFRLAHPPPTPEGKP